MPRRLRIGHARQFRIAADGSSYTLSGQSAAVRLSALITAAQGTYSLSGQAATMSTTGAPAPSPAASGLLFFDYPDTGHTVTIVDGNPTSTPYTTTMAYAVKHHRGDYRQADGRLYFGGGDCGQNITLDAPGGPIALDEGSPPSGAAHLFSMDPDEPMSYRYEMHRHRYGQVSDRSVWHTAGFDQSWFGWDQTRDVGLLFSLNSFYYFSYVTTNTASPYNITDPLVVPRYLSPTSFYVAGNLTASAAFQQHRLFKLQLNDSRFANYNELPRQVIGQTAQTAAMHYGRMVSVTYNSGANRTEVVFESAPGLPQLAWASDGLALLVYYTADYAMGPATGAWLDWALLSYDDTNDKIIQPIMKFDPAQAVPRSWQLETYEWGNIYTAYADGTVDLGNQNFPRKTKFALDSNAGTHYQLNGASSGNNDIGFQSNGMFVPASVTGRTDELIFMNAGSPDGAWIGATIVNMSTRVIEFYATHNPPTGGIARIGPSMVRGIDTTRKRIYLSATNQNGRLYYFDIQRRRMGVLLEKITVEGVDAPNMPQYGGTTVYNSDLDMIEVWHDNGATGLPILYLVDPDTAAVYKMGHVWSTSSVPQTPIGTPSENGPFRGDQLYRMGSITFGYGGEVDDTGIGPDNGGTSTQVAYRKSFFIGNNMDWQELTVGPAWNMRIDDMPQGLDDNDARSMTLASNNLPGTDWCGVVAAIDSSGNPTGELLWRIGGDGDANWNGVCRLFPNAISGTTIPARVNNATDATAAAEWKNRVHSASGPAGGTTYQAQILFNKAKWDANGTVEWQPAAGHHYDARAYHPTRGWIEMILAPNAGAITPETNTYPYTGQSNSLLFGLESYGINHPVLPGSGAPDPNYLNQTSPALVGWKDGVWTRLASLPNAPGGETFIGGGFCEYNASTGKLWFGFTPSSADRTYIYEWDGTSISTKTRSANFGSGNTALIAPPPGKGAVWWLESDKYIVYQVLPTQGSTPFLFLWEDAFNSGAGRSTMITGTVIDSTNAGNRLLTCAIDREHRYVYWMVPPSGSTTSGERRAFRLYRSHFDSLGTLVPVPVKSRNTLDKFWVQTDTFKGRKLMHYYDGCLYVIAPGTVGIAGEAMPNHVRVFRLPVN